MTSAKDNLIDQPIPEINVPIFKPTPYKVSPVSLKSLAETAAKYAKEKINNLAKWITSFVLPEKKKVINERVEILKDDIDSIYKK